MGPDRLNVVALLAHFMPIWLELGDCLVAVFKETLDFFGNPIEPVVFNIGYFAIGAFNSLLDIFSGLSLFQVLPDSLNFLKMLNPNLAYFKVCRATRLNDGRKEVIVCYVVHYDKADGDPDHPKYNPQPLLEHSENDCKVGVHMKT